MCKTWYDEANDDTFWKTKCFVEYGSPPSNPTNWKGVYKSHHLDYKSIEEGFGNGITLQTITLPNKNLDRVGTSLCLNKNELFTTIADTIYVWDLTTGSIVRTFRVSLTSVSRTYKVPTYISLSSNPAQVPHTIEEIQTTIDTIGDLIAVSAITADECKSYIVHKNTGQVIKAFEEKWFNVKLFTPCRNLDKINNSDIFVNVFSYLCIDFQAVAIATNSVKVYAMDTFEVVAEYQLEGMVFDEYTQLQVNNSHFCICHAFVNFLYAITFSVKCREKKRFLM